MKNIRGVTFIELMIVVGLFSVLFSVMVSVMYSSDTFFRKGQDRITEQFEARKVLDHISRGLRTSSPDWVVNGTHYQAVVSENGTRLDYYMPLFGSDNEVAGLRKVTYKLDPSDPKRLLFKEGTSPETVISGRIALINFGAGCAACASYTCATPATDCPVIRLQVRTLKENQFELVTKISLRNRNPTVAEETAIEAPGEGEF